MRRALLLAAAVAALASCKKEEPPPPKKPGFTFAAGSATAKPEQACTFGADQTCNDDPLISSVHGSCNQDGTCSCHPGFALNPQTGRCK